MISYPDEYIRVPDLDSEAKIAYRYIKNGEALDSIEILLGHRYGQRCDCCDGSLRVGFRDWRNFGLSPYAWSLVKAFYSSLGKVPPIKIVSCPYCVGFDVRPFEDEILQTISECSIEGYNHGK